MGKRRVVVTGLGIYSCIGYHLDEVAQSLYQGRSGIGIDPLRTAYGYRSPLTGILETPNLKGVIDRRLRVTLPQEGAYAYMASKQAFEQAGIDQDYLDTHEVGVIYGNDSSAQAVIESHMTILEKKDTSLVGSGAIFQSMNSTVTMNLSTLFRLRGINFTISGACASGSHSIGLGAMFIRDGLQDMVLCGGAQEVNYLSMGNFDGIGAFSTQIQDPTKASRPFDAHRDGLVPSGGAASLILEEYDHAVKRGAPILFEIMGYGFSSNGGHISQPSDTGSLLAMERALHDAGCKATDLDYINAHATSTQQGDYVEALALRKLLAGTRTPISSTKSMTGHECWMAGASEVIYSYLMMRDNFVAPNINLEDPDPVTEGLKIVPRRLDCPVNRVLSNSFGFGGTNSALVIQKL